MQHNQGSTVFKITALIGIILLVAILFYSCRQGGNPSSLEEAEGIEAMNFAPANPVLHG